MPRAGDASLLGGMPLPINRSPLDRISYQPPNVTFDVEAFIAQWTQFVETYLFPIIEDLTGIDLSILQPVLDGLLDFVGFLQDALHAITGGDWSQLLGVFGNLFGFLGFLDIGEGSDFNPITQAIKFFQMILHPTGLIVGTADVLGGVFPLTFPFVFGGAGDSLVGKWFENLRGFMPDFLDPLFDVAEAAAQFIENILKPTGLLAWLDTITGLLPDELSPQAFLDFIHNFIGAFSKLAPIPGLGGLLEGAYDLFAGIFTRGQTNSSSIATLESAVFGEDGVGISIDFSGAAADLDDLGWTTYTYGGTGCVMSQKDDYAYMHGLAGSDETMIMVLDDPAAKLASHIQSRTDFLREKIASSGSTAEWGPLRVNAAAGPSTLSGVYWRAARGGAGGTLDLGVQLNGVSTDLNTMPGADDAQVSLSGLTFAAQDRIDFTMGDSDPALDPVADYDQVNWRWRLWHNTNLVVDYVFNPESWDPDCADLLDSLTYNCPSFAMTADFIFIFVPAMVPPTTVERLVFTVPAV
jgi:hypothetical protein